MQGINEDANIDGTLVTCAEYQLFIDEMRARRKYYQPDHWASYQFPAGHAQWPILGVRHSDALAFCQWLTVREAGEWSYRLPTKAEAASMPPIPLPQSPLGYWLSEHDQFAWVGHVLRDPRGLGAFRDKFARDLKLEGTWDLARLLALDLNRALALDLDRILETARLLAVALDSAVVRARLLASALAPALARLPDRARRLQVSRTRDLARVRDLARARALALAFARLADGARSPDRDLQLAFDLYLDILTLHERVAGRSPAFEGIHIVKERVK